jgi:predicted O-linked N-acetylglucosamine transferase (SPINDLY family)
MSVTRHWREAAAAHLAAGRLAEAAAAYGEVLARAPRDFDALHGLGTLKVQLGDNREGHRLLQAGSEIRQDSPQTWLHLGMAAQNLGRAEEAAGHYRRALSLTPDFPAALFRLAVLLRHLRQPREALALLERCAALAPQEKAVLQQRGETRAELGDGEGALRDFAAVLAADPDAVQALIWRGTVLARQERAEEALAAMDRAAALAPGRAETHFNRGVLLESLDRNEEAMAAYDQAIRLHPGLADAWNNRGNIFRARGRLEEAVDSFRRAVAVAPVHLPALVNRGLALTMLNRNRDAAADFRRALDIAPNDANALGGLFTAALALCDWTTVEALKPRLANDRSGGVSPFQMMLAFDDPALLQVTARAFRERQVPVAAAPRPRPRAGDGRIRLAYVSADFQTHATAYLIADLIARHDRTRVEVTGVSYGTDDGGQDRARLRAAFDRFLDMEHDSGDRIAEALRQLGTDIVIDLKGYTQWARPGIFARRPAPVQVSWLGYPGTLAAPWIDYVLADPVVLPHDQQGFYDERIVHLPDSYQPNDPSRPLANVSRAEAGLPEQGFVFCSFNPHRKITRPVFETWMRLLGAVPGSLLWLLDDSANDALRAHAAARGIDPARLVFAPRTGVSAHLARAACAGLMLDTMPYGAHTTASDALWAGVPIVTCLGPSFANRVAAGLCTAIGLPELIAPSPGAYEALALALAQDPARLAALKAKLAANRLTTPLFDAARFCRHVERAYETMMEIARSGEGPRPFDVPVLES